MLSKLYFAFQGALSKALLSNEGIKLEEHASNIIFQLNASVYGIHHPPKQYQYPANWIEAIKERWLPAWAAKSWPVKYTIITVELREIYPEIQPAIKSQRVEWKIDSTEIVPFTGDYDL